MNRLNLVFLVCLPAVLLAKKCTDPPTNSTDSVTDTVTDTWTDTYTWPPETTTQETTEPPTTTEAIPPPESWPVGKFSLAMAGADCPEFYDFKKGWFYQDTEDWRNINAWPTDTLMIGPLKHDGYKFHFCTKMKNGGSYGFEPGNYCLYQFSRRCPGGFQPGHIVWDDEDDFNQNTKRGRVPFGKYDKNITKVHFCCRDDGEVNQAISLPITRPFYMLRYTGECQKVRYMTVTEEIFVWDDQDLEVNLNSNEGASPMDTGTSTDHVLHFCRYDPK